MRRHHITLGALTTAGGTVISARGIGTINDKTIAVEGDNIACPSCKSTGHIICTGPRHPEIFFGRAVALENDICACKCSPHPRLIPTQGLRYQTIEGSGRSSSNTTTENIAASGYAERNIFDDKFQLIDETTQKPIANHLYAIERENGEIEHGITDEQGHTHLLSAIANAENINVYLEG